MRNRKLAPTSRVRERCGGISKMTLWRWRHDIALNFPQPVIIRGRHFYDDDEITEFLAHLRSPSMISSQAT